jgi:precorrin-6B methylase 2
MAPAICRLILLCAFVTAATPVRAAEPASPDAPVELALDPASTQDLRIGEAPASDTEEKPKPDIFYLPTPQRVVDLMLLMAEVSKDDMLYDLGSGDGRLVITAAKRYGARGIGIEIDPKLLAEARRNAIAAKVQDKVDFRQQDLFKSDFKDATVITLYLLDSLNERLRPQIFAQVKPGTRIVSHAFRMGDWEPEMARTMKLQGKTYDAFFWIVPANMSGRWRVRAEGSTKELPESVVVEQTFQKFTIRRSDGGNVIGEGSLAGKEFVLSAKLGPSNKPASFTGRVEGNTIKANAAGKGASWSAEREPGTEKPLDPGGSATPPPAL